MLFTVLHSVDPALGRLDYESLSDQALMEMLVASMPDEDKKELLDGNSNYLDVCEWSCVKCKDERVFQIDVLERPFSEKQFPFWFIPPSVDTFAAGDEKGLSGTLDTGDLPRGLRYLDIEMNCLHGEFKIKELPAKLEFIYMHGHNFSGSLALADLPKTMKRFEASRNKFSGEITLNSLPPALERLQLSGNALTGSINIERLPGSLKEIYLRENAFSGDFRMSEFPHSLDVVDARRMTLSETVVLGKATGEIPFNLLIHDVTSVVDENGDKHEWHNHVIKISQLL